jgi:AraC-like DNA-binding protein
MLTARGHTSIGTGALRWGVALASRFSLLVVERSGLVFDSSLVPPAPEPMGRGVRLHVLLQGRWMSSDGRTLEAPQSLVLSAEHGEGARGERPWSCRTEGAPYCAIELRFHGDDTSLRTGSTPEGVVLGAPVWDAAHRVALASRTGTSDMREAVRALLEVLASGSMVHSRVVRSARRAPEPGLQTVWRAFRPVIEALDLNPTVKQVCAVSGATPRELDRFVRELVVSCDLVGGSWRGVARQWRLKLAILLLSAEGASVGAVARRVGYGSTDAMARAFRDAALPPPRLVRQQVRGRSAALPARTTSRPAPSGPRLDGTGVVASLGAA